MYILAEKYEVVVAVKGYYTSADAKNRKNPRTTVKAGTYYVFNKYAGMINVSKQKKSPGSWINPSDNKKKTKNNTATQKASSSSAKKAVSKAVAVVQKVNTTSQASTTKLYKTNAFGKRVLRGYIIRDDTNEVIPFQFNPESWTRTHKGVFTSVDAPGSPYPDINYIRQDKRNIPVTIEFDSNVDTQNYNNKTLDTIISNIENLTQPSSKYTIMQRGSKKFVSPPTCRFVFGDKVIKCKVAEVKVTHKKYDKNLKTTACSINLDLLEVV